MEKNKYSDEFQLIAMAGSSRSKSMMALRHARIGNFEEAYALLEKAEEEMRNAHQCQLQVSGNGNTEISILTVHSQDHLAMASVTYDLVSEMIQILKEKQI